MTWSQSVLTRVENTVSLNGSIHKPLQKFLRYHKFKKFHLVSCCTCAMQSKQKLISTQTFTLFFLSKGQLTNMWQNLWQDWVTGWIFRFLTYNYRICRCIAHFFKECKNHPASNAAILPNQRLHTKCRTAGGVWLRGLAWSVLGSSPLSTKTVLLIIFTEMYKKNLKKSLR